MGVTTDLIQFFLLILTFFAQKVVLSINIDNAIATPEIIYKPTAKVAPRCRTYGRPLDLIIIMDSSGSLRGNNEEEVKVIKDLVNIVAVNPDATRIALVQYSGVARSEFHFNTFTDKKQILQAMEVINPIYGITKTGNALAEAINELDPEKGMRPTDVPKIAFLISDGRTQDYPDDVIQATKLRAHGVDIWSYGLGEYVAIEELINVTSDVNKVVTRKNYPHLKELFEQYKGVEICEEISTCVPGSDKPLDLLFLIDSSESVEEKFRDQLNFVNRLLNHVNVHPLAVRVAMIVYSGKSIIDFDFHKYSNNESLRRHLSQLLSRNGTTRTDLALAQAYELFSEKYGARNGSVQKMAIVLTDGHSQLDPMAAAKRLAEIRNLVVFAIAVVPEVQADANELAAIANFNLNNVFTRTNLDQFELSFKNYVSLSCPGLKQDDAEPIVRGPTDVSCNENTVTFTVRTIKPFVGRLYAVGFEELAHCVANGQNQSSVTISLGAHTCGVKRTYVDSPQPGYIFNASLMIQFHPDVITKTDQPLFVNCFAPGRKILQDVSAASAPLPSTLCTYTLRQYHPDEGCVVLDARVGDNVYHKWTCEMAPAFNYMVHSCEAVTDKSTITILDEHGCQVDPYIFETPVYDGKRSFVFRDSPMFKFPGVTWIQFRCKIAICDQGSGNCNGIIPPDCSRRRKRSDFSNQVTQTINVETRRINVLLSDDLKPVEKLKFCQNFY